MVLAVVGLCAAGRASAQNHPFASHGFPYAPGTILPSHVSQAELDQAVRDFYDAWKAKYLAEKCGAGRYVVLSGIGPRNLTVSEAHGYGMMIAALMAGHDPDARAIFDGMYIYFREHPTAFHANLMSWNQSRSCADVEGNDSASDGDLDIAFALLLADKQWGRCGAIDYRAAALGVIADILDGDTDATSQYVTLGDWVTPGSGAFYDATRSSDFITDHFRAFFAASGDGAWLSILNRAYAVVNEIQATASPSTGLLPDFIADPLGSPGPAAPNFLEGPADGEYAFNAARDPWRLGTDFIVSGDARAAAALARLNAWIQAATGGDPSAIRAGYTLDGGPGTDSGFLSMAFVAPFGVGAMADVASQAWLNDIWDLVVATPLSAEGYYENTLKLLSMIVISGNWWAPDQVTGGCVPAGTALCPAPALMADADIAIKRLTDAPGNESLRWKGTLVFPAASPASLVEGAQLLIEDLGSDGTAVFELSQATTPVPSRSAGVCLERGDGWKERGSVTLYRNRSTALDPPACTPGSANGLGLIRYKRASARDVRFTVRARRSTIGPVAGPIRATLVLGSTAGECGVSPALACEPKGSGVRCRTAPTRSGTNRRIPEAVL